MLVEKRAQLNSFRPDAVPLQPASAKAYEYKRSSCQAPGIYDSRRRQIGMSVKRVCKHLRHCYLEDNNRGNCPMQGVSDLARFITTPVRLTLNDLFLRDSWPHAYQRSFFLNPRQDLRSCSKRVREAPRHARRLPPGAGQHFLEPARARFGPL